MFSLVSLINIISSFSLISDSIFNSVVLFVLLTLKLLTFWLLNVISGKLLIDLFIIVAGLEPVPGPVPVPVLFKLFSFNLLLS